MSAAAPLVRARHGLTSGPQVRARYGLVDFFQHVISVARQALVLLEVRVAEVFR